MYIEKHDDEVVVYGTASQIMELAEVEEAHHQAYPHLIKKYLINDPDSVSTAEYDAQEHEIESPRIVLVYTQKTRVSNKTISVLKNRLEQARKFKSG